jgi:Tfp pilus assembly PilM family ATPase
MMPFARHFLEEDVAGVCVRDGLICTSRVARSSDGGLRLRSAGCVEYAPDLSDEALAAEIRHAWRQNRIPTRTVVSCLHSPSVQYRYFQYDNLHRDELPSALALEAEELLKLPRSKIGMDWQAFEHGDGGRDKGRGLEGILVAVPKADLDRHFYLLKHAGLYTVVVDLAPLAAANLFRVLHPHGENGTSTCLLDVSTDTADMVVLTGDGFAYPRSLRSYSATWDRAVDYLAENIEDVLRHTRISLRRPPVTKVYLTGRVGSRETLRTELQDTLGRPVAAWNPLEDMGQRSIQRARSGQVSEKEGAWLTIALGLALRGASRDHV